MYEYTAISGSFDTNYIIFRKKFKKFFLKENKEFDEIFENLSFCRNGILKINYLFI